MTVEASGGDTPQSRGESRRHSIWEDLYAGLTACSLIVFGMVLLKQAGLVTGGIAGLTLLLSYIMPVSPTTLFVVLNIPFFLVAAKVGGRAFGGKSIAANIAILMLGIVLPHALTLGEVMPVFAALFGGSIIGLGLLFLARHGAGVGGIGVMALLLQKKKGWNAGRTQMMCDIVILALSLVTLDLRAFGLSLLSALAINLVLMVNHRPGRYTGF